MSTDAGGQRFVDYDPPPMVEQVKWAIEHKSAVDATKMLLRHAVNCTMGDLCPTCRAIKDAVDG